MNREVLFLDSGVGGLPYLDWFRKCSPETSVIYLADSKNFPYGSKSSEDVKESASKSIEQLLKIHNPQLIVIACNTASVVALDYLRKKFNLPFVGVVPALKPAAETTKNGSVGLLATAQTVNAAYTDNLIAQFGTGCKIYREAAGDIVKFVEEKLLDSSIEEQDRVVLKPIENLKKEGIDRLVLGCTHFLHLAENIGRLAGENIELVDSVEGVGRQILRKIDRKENSSDSKGLFYVTNSKNGDYYERMAQHFSLDFKGEI